MKGNAFFDESQEQSEVKTTIVTKYFWAWAKVIISSQKRWGNEKIAYIDLFAGPGRYKDGTMSTPLRILESAVKDSDMRDMLVTIFNDKDTGNTQTLDQAIQSVPNIMSLKFKPQVHNEEVGDNIVQMFEQMRLVPALFFVDPWGYKGLSLRLINSVLKNWGCECIIFFNYNRINMGLHNEAVDEHMDALFGKERANSLRLQIESMRPYQREMTIIGSLTEALKEMGGQYVLPFRFKNARGTRTSHHLIFVSKGVKGYEIMKEVMAKESSTTSQGVPSFEYNPALHGHSLLFELSNPLDDLEVMLVECFANRKMTMLEVFDQHHVGNNYLKSNYKNVLSKLEAKGKITVDPPAEKRPVRKGLPTFGDGVYVTFPPKGN
jgi:three-Cys-motif partner protein